MRRLVEISLAHRLVVILITILMIGAGWTAFRRLPIDAFPDVTSIQVTVISQVSTLSPGGVRGAAPGELRCGGDHPALPQLPSHAPGLPDPRELPSPTTRSM